MGKGKLLHQWVSMLNQDSNTQEQSQKIPQPIFDRMTNVPTAYFLFRSTPKITIFIIKPGTFSYQG